MGLFCRLNEARIWKSLAVFFYQLALDDVVVFLHLVFVLCKMNLTPVFFLLLECEEHLFQSTILNQGITLSHSRPRPNPIKINIEEITLDFSMLETGIVVA